MKIWIRVQVMQAMIITLFPHAKTEAIDSTVRKWAMLFETLSKCRLLEPVVNIVSLSRLLE